MKEVEDTRTLAPVEALQEVNARRRRHKKRAKKQRIKLPPIQSQPLRAEAQIQIAQQGSKATAKRRKRRQMKVKALQSTEPVVLALPVLIQIPMLSQQTAAPAEEEATGSGRNCGSKKHQQKAKQQPHQQRFDGTTKHSSAIILRMRPAQVSQAQQWNTEPHLVGLKQLFKSTGDVTKTPPDILDQIFFEQIMPAHN